MQNDQTDSRGVMRRRFILRVSVWLILVAIGFVPAVKVGWVVVFALLRFAWPDASAPLSTDGPNQVVLAVPAMT